VLKANCCKYSYFIINLAARLVDNLVIDLLFI